MMPPLELKVLPTLAAYLADKFLKNELEEELQTVPPLVVTVLSDTVTRIPLQMGITKADIINLSGFPIWPEGLPSETNA